MEQILIFQKMFYLFLWAQLWETNWKNDDFFRLFKLLQNARKWSQKGSEMLSGLKQFMLILTALIAKLAKKKTIVNVSFDSLKRQIGKKKRYRRLAIKAVLL